MTRPSRFNFGSGLDPDLGYQWDTKRKVQRGEGMHSTWCHSTYYNNYREVLHQNTTKLHIHHILALGFTTLPVVIAESLFDVIVIATPMERAEGARQERRW